MLSSQRYYDHLGEHHQGKPWLVFLHGLLGNGKDWLSVLPFMQDYPCLTIDLPGHGTSSTIQANSFQEVKRLLVDTLKYENISSYILIGYSLGGRIAMFHACHDRTPGLVGLVVEGAHLGLQSVDEKQQRIIHDCLWADQFRKNPICDVLNEWYNEPVFADLTSQEREQLVKQRRYNSGRHIADMLEATSLGRQPWLGDLLAARLTIDGLPFCYLCGENDTKFQQLAADHQLPLTTITQAGHNAHRSNPAEFAQQLISFLKEC